MTDQGREYTWAPKGAKVRACPFCGSDDKLWYYSDDDEAISIECNCGAAIASTKSNETIADLITSWNTRADDARVTELEKKYHRMRLTMRVNCSYCPINIECGGGTIERCLNHLDFYISDDANWPDEKGEGDE